MGLSLLRGSPTFRASIEECASILHPYGLNLVAEFEAVEGFLDPSRAAVGLAAIQIALLDMLRDIYGVIPDGMLGHSAGGGFSILLVQQMPCNWHGFPCIVAGPNAMRSN